MSLHVRRNLFLVRVVRVCTSLKKKLTHLVVILLYRVVERCLLIMVDKVGIGSVLDHEVSCFQMALLCDIEERSLTVSVNVIHIATLINQKLYKSTFSFSCSVVKCSLLQVIHVIDFAALVMKVMNHVKRFLFILDDNCSENSVLIVRHVIQVFYRSLHDG